MSRSFLSVLLGAVGLTALLVGCASDGPTTTCGDNTEPVNGVCETRIRCDPDTTVLVNFTCQPIAGAGACGDGTENVGGQCVPSDAACDAGTRLVDGVCVPNFDVVCGAGTEANTAGECVQVLDLDCGPGTAQEAVSSDSGKQEVAICVPLCTGDQIYDESVDGCVDACTRGAEFDATTNTCRALCADDQFYVSSADACVDVPECLRNAEDVDGDCVGYPFHELSLETVCARRAFNICQPIFDPACGCEHAGDYLGSGPENGVVIEGGGPPRPSDFGDDFPADLAGCVFEELFVCDLLLSQIRALEDEGQLEADTEALQEFDDYFRIPAGTCTRPSDFEPLPGERFFQLTNGLVPEGGDCFNLFSCADTHQCLIENGRVGGLPPFFGGTCQPRAALGQPCGFSLSFDGGFPGDPTTSILCRENLLCLFDEGDARNECSNPRALGVACNSDGDCQEGLFCFPADLDEFDSGESFANVRTCQNPQTEGIPCLADSRSHPSTAQGSVSVTHDVCASNLRCEETERGTANDGVGQCVAAFGVGTACDYCNEYQLTESFVPIFGGPRVDWYRQDPFSQCGGDLVCTFEALTEGFDETCEAQISVCPPTLREVEEAGGVCNPFEFVCDDGLDEDGDSGTDCADDDCVNFSEVCNCEDNEDNDGDDLVDCDDPDCAANEACG